MRGSHIVLPMPEPADLDAYTLQDEGERIVFAIPWLDARFLIVGTTDVPHEGDPGEAHCSPEEKAYLLHAYNRYFTSQRRPMTERDIVFTWSGVRALHGGAAERPSRISRGPSLDISAPRDRRLHHDLRRQAHHPPRPGRRAFWTMLGTFGLEMSGPWTKDVPLYGGSLPRPSAARPCGERPGQHPAGDPPALGPHLWRRIEALFARIEAEPAAAEEIAPGVPRAELEYAVEAEDAMTAEDFLLRRTKLHLLLDESGRDAVAAMVRQEPDFVKTTVRLRGTMPRFTVQKANATGRESISACPKLATNEMVAGKFRRRLHRRRRQGSGRDAARDRAYGPTRTPPPRSRRDRPHRANRGLTARLGRLHFEHRAVGADHFDARALRQLGPFHPPDRVAGMDAAAPIDDRIDEIEGLADELRRALVEQRPARFQADACADICWRAAPRRATARRTR